MGFEINIYTHVDVHASTASSGFISVKSWPHLKSVRLTQQLQFLDQSTPTLSPLLWDDQEAVQTQLEESLSSERCQGPVVMDLSVKQTSQT